MRRRTVGAATTAKDVVGKVAERNEKVDDQRNDDSDHCHSGRKGSTPCPSHQYSYRRSHTPTDLHPTDNKVEREEEWESGSSIGQQIESCPHDLVTSFGAVLTRPCPQQDAYLALGAHASALRTLGPRRSAAARNVAARFLASDLTAESPLVVMP